jgi:hypothetical protein
MADIERMKRALVAADQAGDVEAATALAKALRQATAAAPAAGNQKVEEAKSARDKFYSGGIYGDGTGIMAKIGKSIGAASDMVGSGITFGFDDEINAGISTGVGFVGDYSEAQKGFDARKDATREQNPVASTVGELAGGLATSGGLAKRGATLLGKFGTAGMSGAKGVAARAGLAAAEGAGYGALYGAGDAEQGDRLRGAAVGGAVGGLTAGLMSTAGDGVANYAARRATKKAVAAAPSAAALKQTEDQLFNAARTSGVQIKPQAAQNLVQNMRLAAGRPNDKIRPQTAGLIDDIMANPSAYYDIQALHELRQEIGELMGTASGQDSRTLGAMKRVLDNFIDNPSPSAFNGPASGFSLLREGIQTSAKRFKAKEIETLLDLADVVAEGNVTQSGIAAALRTKAGQLYTRIAKGQVHGFLPEEVKMIRELASRNTSSKAIKWLAKWSPSGPMSTTLAAILGGGAGFATGAGPVGAMIGASAVMAPGAAARNIADRSAIAAGSRLRASAALGGLPKVQPGINRLSKYAVPAAIAATQSLPQQPQNSGLLGPR